MTNAESEKPRIRFLSMPQVRWLHARELEKHGGAPGIRDVGALDSALAQPRQTWSGEYLHKTVWEKAAAYLYHISQNHPFVDGNKRTGFAAASTFLLLNGWEIVGSVEHYRMVMKMAGGELSKEQVAEYLEKFGKPIAVPKFPD